MTRPTESAINEFHVVRQHSGRAFIRIPVGDPNAEIALAIKSLADGLINLSTGLRATYMLLEEVKGLLQKQAGKP
jgi:hypothetical protein